MLDKVLVALGYAAAICVCLIVLWYNGVAGTLLSLVTSAAIWAYRQHDEAKWEETVEQIRLKHKRKHDLAELEGRLSRIVEQDERADSIRTTSQTEELARLKHRAQEMIDDHGLELD